MNLRGFWAGICVGALVFAGCSGPEDGAGVDGGDATTGGDGGGASGTTGDDGGGSTGEAGADGGGSSGGGDGGGQDDGGEPGSTRTRGVGKQMLSVAPEYALADDEYAYSPRHTLNGDVRWEVVEGPEGMTLEDGRVKWQPTHEQRGEHEVKLRAAVGDDEVTQSYTLRVSGVRERASREMESGSLSVVSPTSDVRGAGIHVGTGSLEEARTLRISEPDESPRASNARSELRTVDFGPNGTTFEQPATLSLPYDNSGDSDPSRVGAYTYNTESGRWERVRVVEVDEDNGVVLARASHFSLYAAIESSLDLDVSLERMDAGSACEGQLVARVELASALAEVELGAINSLSEEMKALGASDVAALIANPGFSGSLRFVRVVQLGQGEGDARVPLQPKLWVSTLYVDPETGEGVLTHTDALGNVMAERVFEDVPSFLTDIDTHLRGLTTQRVLSQTADAAYDVSGRLHIIYSPADATVVGASLGDLGPAAVDAPPSEVPVAAEVSEGFDVDCDGYRAPYDGFDDSLQPKIVAAPEEGVTVIEGAATLLRAAVVDSNATPTNAMWSVEGGGGTLTAVEGEPDARSFSATLPGRYTVVFGASADGVTLEKRFAVQVLEAPTVNTPPSCEPTPAANEMVMGGTLGVSAAVADAETPADALTVRWGLVDLSAQTPSLIETVSLEGEGSEVRFTPPSEGTFAIGCQAFDGALDGEVGYASVGVLPPAINRSPRDFSLSPLAKNVVVGGAVTFTARASDPEGDVLSFTWEGLPAGATTQTDTASTSQLAVDTAGMAPGLYTVRTQVSDGQNPALEVEASLFVMAEMLDPSEVDEDADGFPASLDCDDGNSAIHPAALEICGDPGDVDENCDGVARTSDCDGDGTPAGEDCDDGDRSIGPHASELCDGIDNDCDGIVDDGFDVGAACEVGVGACTSTGVVRCTPSGNTSLCEGTPLASSAEVCDGLDNDCDGSLDDDASACVDEKVGVWWQCSDAFCSGLIDEGILLSADGEFANLHAPLGSEVFDPDTEAHCAGETGSWDPTGLRTLRVSLTLEQGPVDIDVTVTSLADDLMTLQFVDPDSGQDVQEHYRRLEGAPGGLPAACDFQPGCEPLAEMCNDVDDDCDLLIDEDGVCDGFCACDTSAACDGDPTPCSCDADCGEPTCMPQSEFCDGVDNDCDGQIDENAVCDGAISGDDEALGRWFMCAEPGCATLSTIGFMFLNDGTLWFLNPEDLETPYDPAKPYCVNGGGTWTRLSANEIQLDWLEESGDPITLRITTSVVGDYWHWSYDDPDTGVPQENDMIPVADNSVGACVFDDGCSGPEVCNGYDDDCDGLVDEGFDVGPEICDGADNDCDGLVDNLQPSPCTVPDGVGQCALGQPGCNGLVEECQPLYAPDVEYCEDGRDSDCDGDASLSEAGCTALPAGEQCDNAIDVSAGGVFVDSLSGALDLVPGECGEGGPLPDRLFRFDVPSGGREVFLGVRPTSALVCDKDGYDNDDDAQVDEAGEPCEPWRTSDSLRLAVLSGSCPSSNGAWCLYGSRVQQNWFEPGTYFLVVESQYGPVDFELSVAMRTDAGSQCSPVDGDGDGLTICDQDCNDTDGQVYPGAPEICDGIDNDCNGGIDDMTGSCSVAGQLGACAVGRGHCEQGAMVCEQITYPAPEEYCGDGVDNDCDGELDETGCLSVAAGELCGLAQPLTLGAVTAGSLAGALDNAEGYCGQPAPELFYRFDLTDPTDVVVDVRDLGCGCDADPGLCDAGCGCDPQCAAPCACDLEPDLCEEGCACDVDCGGPVGDGGGLTWKLAAGACDGVALQQSGCEWSGNGPRNWALPAGTHYLMVEGPEGQDFEVALASFVEGQCMPGDDDADGFTVCDGDCAEGDATRHPGASEICDGLDNDCDGQVDDVEGACTVGGQTGVCDQGALACQGGEPVCQQVTFPGELQEVCADGLDNDCDGEVDENALPGDCLALLPGETCNLAIPLPTTGGATGTLNGASDDFGQGCGADGDPEIFFTFEVPDLAMGAEVATIIQTRLAEAQAGAPLAVELRRGEPCTSEGWSCSYVGSEYWELQPGTWTLVVAGPEPVDVEVRVAFEDPSGSSCSQPDADGDGYTMCAGDCAEGYASTSPDQAELCDGVDNDCNGSVDDLQGSCIVADQTGPCAQGLRLCEGMAETCMQVNFPGEEYCADGVDNDCDGEADAADTGGCTTVPPGQVCGLPIDVSAGGVFGFDMAQASDDLAVSCGPSGPEVFFGFTLSEPGEVFWEVRRQGGGAPGPDVWVGVFEDPSCSGGSYCTDPGFSNWFEAGSYVLAVEGPTSDLLELSIAFADGQGGCVPGDADGDGWTVCGGDCNDGDPNVWPGQTEICNGLDDDCNGAVDDVFGACTTGLAGLCDQGKRVCVSGEEQCEPEVQPGSVPDFCANGVDDDCNGSVDDNCVEPEPGDFCEVSQPLPLGPVGGTIAGTLNYQSPCWPEDPERIDTVYSFQVPVGGAWFEVTGSGTDTWYDIYQGTTCAEWLHDHCASEGDSYWLSGGDYHLVVTAPVGAALDFEVFITEPICGDGYLDPGEQCDDGNAEPADGCAPDCTFEGLCGDGVQDPDEQCDDGNTMSGDGCSAVCTVEASLCGNGMLDPEEVCDDGNELSGDGCSADCMAIEPGFSCPMPGMPCEPI